MNVYVIQQPVPNATGWMPDFSIATEYGKIQYIFEGGEKVHALPGPSLFKVRKLLREKFDHTKDYILWPNTGDPMACIIACIALGELDIEYINCLYWNRKRNSDGVRDAKLGFYSPIKINLKERKEDKSFGVDQFLQNGDQR